MTTPRRDRLQPVSYDPATGLYTWTSARESGRTAERGEAWFLALQHDARMIVAYHLRGIDYAVVEDIASEVVEHLLSFCRHELPTDERNLRSFILARARWRAGDGLRRYKRECQRQAVALDHLSTDSLERGDVETAAPHEALTADATAQVEQAIGLAGIFARLPVELHGLAQMLADGARPAQVAQRLGCEPGDVLNQIAQLRRALSRPA